MGPKKRGAPAPASRKKKKSRINLANDLSLSIEEEEEIRSAFDLFVDADELGSDVIETSDVAKAMRALGFKLSNEETAEIVGALDEEETGIVAYDVFLEVCAMKIRDRDAQEEVDRAYALFTNGTDGPITLAHLKRVAKSLNENISDETLRDMLMEASTKDRMRVDKRDFEDVMRRAGIL